MLSAEDKEKLYRDYRDRILGYIRARVDIAENAEDLCEDVFEKAFRAADTYNPELSAPGTWLYAITRNTITDYYRRVRPSEELPEDLSDDALPEDDLLKRELLESLAKAMEKLSADLADIVVMRYYDRIPLTEIAVQLGMSYGAVKLRHQKALAILKKSIDR